MGMAIFDTKATSDAGKWLEPLDLDWETKIGCSILVMGPDSEEAAKISDEEDRFTQSRLVASWSGGKVKPTEDEIKNEKEIRKAVRITKDWKDIEWGGVVFPYSVKNAERLYTQCPIIRAQVISYYNNRSNFMTPGYATWKAQSGHASSSTSPVEKEPSEAI